MLIHDLNDGAVGKERSAVVLGNFDGVHSAHRELIRLAGMSSLPCAVFTFSGQRPPYITSEKEKLSLIGECGADLVYLCDFQSVKDMSCERFFEEILIDGLNIGHAFCGYNYTFGKGASGNAGTLEALCREHGIGCTVMPEKRVGDLPVSSSRIRSLLTEGDLECAGALLSHRFFIDGRVSHGRQIGSGLGFPTINIPYESGRVTLPRGVYYTLCRAGERTYPSITNVGVRPTFSLHELVSETNLLDAGGDFYGADIRIEFIRFVRPEKKFSTPIELSRAIKHDINGAKEFFKTFKE